LGQRDPAFNNDLIAVVPVPKKVRPSYALTKQAMQAKPVTAASIKRSRRRAPAAKAYAAAVAKAARKLQSSRRRARKPRAAKAAKTIETRAGANVNLGSAVELGSVPDILVDGPIFQFDPAFWQASAALAAAGSRPRRLMLREFERFYSDQAIEEKKGNATYYRRVVEERLVFAHIFSLG